MLAVCCPWELLEPGIPPEGGIGLLLPGDELLDELEELEDDELLCDELLEDELLDDELLDDELLEELLEDEDGEGGVGICGVVGLLALGQPVSTKQAAVTAAAKHKGRYLTPFRGAIARSAELCVSTLQLCVSTLVRWRLLPFLLLTLPI